MKTIKQILILLTATALMTACVDSETNKLDNRAAAYWQLKVDKHFDKAYEFLSPGWKKTDSMTAYQQRMMVSKADWTSGKVVKKECSETDLCVVTMEIGFNYQFKQTGGTKMEVVSNIKETWIMRDNIWYMLPMKNKLSH